MSTKLNFLLEVIKKITRNVEDVFAYKGLFDAVFDYQQNLSNLNKTFTSHQVLFSLDVNIILSLTRVFDEKGNVASFKRFKRDFNTDEIVQKLFNDIRPNRNKTWIEKEISSVNEKLDHLINDKISEDLKKVRHNYLAHTPINPASEHQYSTNRGDVYDFTQKVGIVTADINYLFSCNEYAFNNIYESSYKKMKEIIT